MRNLSEALEKWLAAGGREIGEIILQWTGSAWELHHRADLGRTDLTSFVGPDAARELAHYDDEGQFRPLKTAPNLRHGWRLTISSLADLRRALDYFYPAMTGIWFSQLHGQLNPVPLRTTLSRQTGMYRVTHKITDAQAQAMVGEFCRTEGGCLKRLLWQVAPETPITSLPAEKFLPSSDPAIFPLLCHEACNLLVAKAREVVKKTEIPT